MKKETYYCDRCGKEIQGFIINNRGFHIENIHNNHEYMDLCQDCYNSLADWVKGGKEKESKVK